MVGSSTLSHESGDGPSKFATFAAQLYALRDLCLMPVLVFKFPFADWWTVCPYSL